ncbi:hypothetical protein J0383_19450 [Flavobacterium endoglycinae]|uniref:Uncharacterized protein n=1 Tax=Flavobacterium endoglycinae TaxID=2816357 RepID=A0ABX7QBT9_9FLAO|nr:hypothetical protein [Flavobacterium endoglycinae]QSW88417.1 hypothetical protein J0383_19450 [Flavobacterium endoglycinae]
MKTVQILIAGIMFLLVTPSRAQNLTKQETVNYINKKITEARNKIHPFVIDDKVQFAAPLSFSDSWAYIYENNLASGSNNKIVYTGSFATDQYGCYNRQHYNFTTPEYYSGVYSSVEFLPAHISAVEIIQTQPHQEVGLLKLSFIPNALKQLAYQYKKRVYCTYPGNGDAFCDCWNYDSRLVGSMYTSTYFDYDTVIYIPFLKLDGDENRLKKAFEYLKDLYLAEQEDDPFGK